MPYCTFRSIHSSLNRLTIIPVFSKDDEQPFTSVDLLIWKSSRSTYIVNSRRGEQHERSAIQYSSIAQLAEHSTVNRRVTGSSPVGGAR